MKKDLIKVSQEILSVVEKSNKILLSFHRSPDLDSIGSTMAMYKVLTNLGKEVTVISPDKPDLDLSHIDNIENLKVKDISDIDLSDFDLFFALDTAKVGLLTFDTQFSFPTDLVVVNIDHHYSNNLKGKIDIIDSSFGSTGELIYNILVIWKIDMDSSVANSLLAAIVGDTRTFRHGTTADTLKVASELISKGADLQVINFNLYQNTPLNVVRFWAEVLRTLEIKEVGKFKYVMVAIPQSRLAELGGPEVNQNAANMFLGIIKDTDFGILAVEEKEGEIKGSFRGRTNVDVSKLAAALGGGGHKSAAGFLIKSAFDDAVEKIIQTVNKELK